MTSLTSLPIHLCQVWYGMVWFNAQYVTWLHQQMSLSYTLQCNEYGYSITIDNEPNNWGRSSMHGTVWIAFVPYFIYVNNYDRVSDTPQSIEYLYFLIVRILRVRLFCLESIDVASALMTTSFHRPLRSPLSLLSHFITSTSLPLSISPQAFHFFSRLIVIVLMPAASSIAASSIAASGASLD